MQHDSIQERLEEVKQSIEVAKDRMTEMQAEPVDAKELGLEMLDNLVTSGLIEQYGAEFGISSVIVALLLAVYWRLRGKTKLEIDAMQEESEPIKDTAKEAEAEVNQLKKLENGGSHAQENQEQEKDAAPMDGGKESQGQGQGQKQG